MADSRAPLLEICSIRLDEDLRAEIEEQRALLELAVGVEVSTGAFVRLLIRRGLALVRERDAPG